MSNDYPSIVDSCTWVFCIKCEGERRDGISSDSINWFVGSDYDV